MKNDLEIWQASTKLASQYADPLIATLTDKEISRGRRLIDPERCQRFLLAQAILRGVLSCYLNQPPESIVFERGEHGKPYLKNSSVRFNLTHSHEAVIVAVTDKGEVGVDVEYTARTHHFDALVKRFFSEEERAAYFSYTSEQERRIAFYRAWTRKEAYLKATGLGLSYPLNQFTVSLVDNEQHSLLSVEDDKTVRTKWTLFSFNLETDYLASVAIEAMINSTQTYIWSFDRSY